MSRQLRVLVRPAALHFLIFLASLSGIAASATSDPGGEPFKIYVEETGVYRLSWEDLAAAGLGPEPMPSADLALAHRGEPTAIRVDDGGDGLFGPGDHLEWIGERLAGETTYFNPHSSLNVYWLHVAPDSGVAALRMETTTADDRGDGDSDADRENAALAKLFHDEHLEQDTVLVRFRGHREGTELWYWKRMSQIDKPPFRQLFDLSEYRAAADEPVSLRIAMRGWSTLPGGTALTDHQVEVRWNGELVAGAEWDGQKEYILDIDALSGDIVRAGENSLEIRVPKRRTEPEAQPVVDVVLLNWIELHIPRKPILGAASERLRLAGTAAVGETLYFLSEEDRQYVVFTADGHRLEPRRTALPTGRTRHSFERPASPEIQVVAGDAYLAPVAIERDRPSHLRDPENQADYLMITHPTLREAVEPLAAYHRERGLRVEIVDVEDIYDEMGDGIVHPRAIRDFLSHAYHSWRPPAPRFVLLVGDASWDISPEADDANYADWTFRPGERRFVKNQSTPYATQATLGHRNLIPTWHFESGEGHAASDNYFVAIDGVDHLPDMAIGRLPVTEPGEVAAIVEKTLAYARGAEVGPWRRRILWITNEETSFQRFSDRIESEEARPLGYAPLKIYPSPDEESNAAHQATLRGAFDEGQLLVHFFGHGGRYIWRTGPPDYRKNHDLFTLDDLDTLAPTVNLPVVLSMTCYSAPFDHPTADSIGEKFLRLADRGAVAVFAASWRNAPRAAFSSALVRELTIHGATLGEAILNAKREVQTQAMVEMYNLLGDPALELAVPGLDVVLTADGPGAVQAAPPQDDFSGRAVVDWLDAQGEILVTEEREMARGEGLQLRAPDENAASVRVYVWNAEQRIDGMGFSQLSWGSTEPENATPETAPPADTAAGL